MNILEMVKARLGISSNKRDSYLNAIIAGILSELKNLQGLEVDEENAYHLMFVVDYACYRYKNVGEESGMPRHLQWRLHNLMVGDKSGSN